MWYDYYTILTPIFSPDCAQTTKLAQGTLAMPIHPVVCYHPPSSCMLFGSMTSRSPLNYDISLAFYRKFTYQTRVVACPLAVQIADHLILVEPLFSKGRRTTRVVVFDKIGITLTGISHLQLK
jgi:hypothetical protein